ncbi:MAG: Gfo/Idh/MocA family oxidoreductase [Candidatus Acidiferrales bacterium]
MNYRVAIIGAGRIGAMMDDPSSPHILTHAHGYKACDGFEVVGFVDQELAKAEAASARWGGAAFKGMEELFETQAIDVVSICLPDDLHYATLLALAKKPIKFIFLEKPAVTTTAEADVVRTLYSELPTRVQVNYTRRFVPEIRRIREAIKSGNYGAFITGTGYYGKGLLHNGSHVVDLLQFLVGEVGKVAKVSETVDFYDHDPSVSALLTMCSGGVFYLSHIDSRKFHVFELDLTFERKRIRIRELGTIIEEYSVGDNGSFAGHRTLNKDADYPTEHSKAMYHAIANIRNNLDRNEPLVSTLQESLDTVKTCSRISRGHAE